MKSSFHHRRGFTLIELLVVMTIIAVLAAGIIAGTQVAMRNARKLQATNIAVAIANGIQNFRSDYGKWPVSGGSGGADISKKSDDTSFITNLIGDNTTINKRGRNFIDAMPNAKGTNPPKGGIKYTGTSPNRTAAIYDPWGQAYEILIDGNGDGQLANPEGGDAINLKVAVISPGQDGKMLASEKNEEGQDGNKDNARSW